jgi:ABC-2 type transport system permease protein
LETRVLAVDDVMGVRMEAGEPVFFMEGTESAEMRETYQAVRMLVLSPSDMSVVKTEDLGRERSPLTEVLSVAVLLMATLMGGYGAAFNMVNEKETGAIRALAVSPLNLMEFIAARGLFTLIGGAFISLVLSFVLVGVRVNIPLLLLAVLASGIVGVLFALIIGGFGSNVVNAIALMKGTMPLYLAMPILAVFLAEKWQPFFWVFPSYWQYHMLTNVFGSGTQDYTFLFTMLMTVGVSLIWAAAMFIPLKRRFRLR